MTRVQAIVVVVLGALLAGGCQSGRAVKPFNGKDLSNWHVKGDAAKSKWTVGVAAVCGRGGDGQSGDEAWHEP